VILLQAEPELFSRNAYHHDDTEDQSQAVFPSVEFPFRQCATLQTLIFILQIHSLLKIFERAQCYHIYHQICQHPGHKQIQEPLQPYDLLSGDLG